MPSVKRFLKIASRDGKDQQSAWQFSNFGFQMRES
jgi:hypothetical protein